MSTNTSQEKTEKATPKRKRDSRKKGQVPRSKETVSCILLLSVSIIFYVLGEYFFTNFGHILARGFILHQGQAIDLPLILGKAKQLVIDAMLLFKPIFIVAILGAYLGNIALSGHTFNVEKLQPKLSNINPMKGLQKIFSTKGLSELLQAIIKCILIGVVTVIIVKSTHQKFLLMSQMPLYSAAHMLEQQLLFTFVILALSTIIIALVDLPIQLYQNNKQLRMTKQEVKDEMRHTDGNPEIKGKLRQLQRQASRRSKMLQDLPNANIVIINPTHFAVALKYDSESMIAPKILAMGTDFVALNIRRICTELTIPILQIPSLARVLYYHGEVGEMIPEALFHAVAQVFAYIFQLDDPLQFHLEKQWIDKLPIPEEMTTTEM